MTNVNIKAQLHVMDAIVASAIIILSIVFARYVGSTYSVVYPGTAGQIKTLADDTLRILDSRNSTQDTNCTQLEYYLDQRVRFHTLSDFQSSLNESIPLSIYYNVWIYNSSSGETMLWCPSKAGSPFGIVACSHRIVYDKYNDIIYDVILEVWKG